MAHVFQYVVFSKTPYSRVALEGISAFQSYEKHTHKKFDFTYPFLAILLVFRPEKVIPFQRYVRPDIGGIMQMQLTLDFTPRPSNLKPIIKNTTWMNVSDVAKGIGFTIQVEVSIALSDVLMPLQSEDDEDYDQRLYDALWLAHHYLSLDPRRPSISFTFDFLREDKHTGKFTEASLRLRVEAQNQVVLLGLMQDF